MTSRGKRLRWALLLASIMAVVALSTPAATTDPCAQTYKGISAASEPEQQALQTLFTQLFPDQKGADRPGANHRPGLVHHHPQLRQPGAVATGSRGHHPFVVHPERHTQQQRFGQCGRQRRAPAGPERGGR